MDLYIFNICNKYTNKLNEMLYILAMIDSTRLIFYRIFFFFLMSMPKASFVIYTTMLYVYTYICIEEPADDEEYR